MNWFHPQNWTDQKDFGINNLSKFADYFSSALTAAGYAILWKTIMNYQWNEYPNMCVVAELMISLSSSNSAVERGFSTLTMMLSDEQLKALHDLMNYCLTIKINDKNWSETEKSAILQ